MSLPTYRGYPVLTWEPDWIDPSSGVTFRRDKERLDNPAGRFADDAAHSIGPRTVRRHRYVFGARAEMQAARDFLQITAQGALNAFWVPTWTPDLTLAAPALSADTALVVTPFGYRRFLAGVGRGRTHLALFPQAHLAAGIYREIVSNVQTLVDATLTLDSALGSDLLASDMVCFLLLCRCAEDELVLQWENMTIGILELQLLDVPWETP